MNYSALKAKEIKSREDIAEADRKAKERMNTLNAITGLATGGLSGVGSLLRGIGSNRMHDRQQMVSKEHVNHPDKRGYTESFIYGQDFSWYNRLVDVREYAKVPNFSQLGNTKFEVIGVAPVSGLTSHGFSPAGVCVYTVAPYYGCPYGAIDDPLNYALVEQVTQIRSRTSVDEQLEASDFGIYEVGCLEIIKLIVFIKKCLALCSTFDHDNAYIGKTVLFDHINETPSSIAANLPIWRNTLNLQIKRFNENLPLPSTLAVVERFMWLYSVILRDSTVRKSQIYTFKPLTFGQLREDLDPIGVYMTGQTGDVGNTTPQRFTMTVLLSRLTAMLTSMIDSFTNMHVIRAIRSAIREELFVKIELAAKDDELLILDIDEPLDQIINLQTAHANLAPFNPSFSVVQTSSGFCRQHWPFTSNNIAGVGNTGPTFFDIANPQANASNLSLDDLRLEYEIKESVKVPLNFYSKEVSEEQVVIGTRMRPDFSHLFQVLDRRVTNANGTIGTDYFSSLAVTVAGDSIICYGKLYTAIGTTTNADSYSTMHNQHGLYFTTDYYDGIAYSVCKFASITRATPSLRVFSALSNFDWLAPVVTVGAYSSGTAYDDAPLALFEQWCNYVPYNVTSMRILHTACLSSEFSYADITFLNYRG